MTNNNDTINVRLLDDTGDSLTPDNQHLTPEYTDDNIRHLSDMDHIRTRPGMYIGRLGDGTLPEDGIYV
ncbi:MAG: type IIA DNA topoisomerase subunit B, partial [Prevotella sp.]